jgi:hypothetical protein
MVETFTKIVAILHGERDEHQPQRRVASRDELDPLEVSGHRASGATCCAERAEEVLFARASGEQPRLAAHVVVPPGQRETARRHRANSGISGAIALRKGGDILAHRIGT